MWGVRAFWSLHGGRYSPARRHLTRWGPFSLRTLRPSSGRSPKEGGLRLCGRDRGPVPTCLVRSGVSSRANPGRRANLGPLPPESAGRARPGRREGVDGGGGDSAGHPRRREWTSSPPRALGGSSTGARHAQCTARPLRPPRPRPPLGLVSLVRGGGLRAPLGLASLVRGGGLAGDTGSRLPHPGRGAFGHLWVPPPLSGAGALAGDSAAYAREGGPDAQGGVEDRGSQFR